MLSPALRLSPEASLPPAMQSLLWRGHALARMASGSCVPSGFAALDAQLPGGGWPTQGLTEILSAGPLPPWWPLSAPALAGLDGPLVLVGPPQMPHGPGLAQAGLALGQLVWVQAGSAAERLWSAEQVLKAQACAALLLWLPQALPAQIRRLQLCAQASTALVFVFRPLAAQHESSAAPLRLHLQLSARPGELAVHILKRRGPQHEGWLHLPAWPAGLQALSSPRLRRLGLTPTAADAPSHQPVSLPVSLPISRPVNQSVSRTVSGAPVPLQVPVQSPVQRPVQLAVELTGPAIPPTERAAHLPAQAALFPPHPVASHALDRLAPAARRAAARV